MKQTIKSNIRNIQVNDTIEITYKEGGKKSLLVTRVEEKSWYYNNDIRSSYGTLERLFNNSGDVINCKIIKAN